MRSYRKVNQMLLVFGIAGLALGITLVVFFTIKRHMFLIGVGLVYILISLLLLGIRGVLVYLGEINKRWRADSQTRRSASS